MAGTVFPRRAWRSFAAGAAAIGVIGTTIAVLSTGSPGTPVNTAALANLWVNTAAGATPTRCSSPCSYNSANAYGSFATAYAAASPGDTIYVEGGSYGAQTIAWDAAKNSSSCDGWVSQSGDVTPVTSGCITFAPAPGETPTFTGGITIDGSDVRIRNFNLNPTPGTNGYSVQVNDGSCGAGAGNRPSYIIVDGVQARGVTFDASSYVSLINSTIDPNDTAGPATDLSGCTSGLTYLQPDHVRFTNDLYENVLESASHHDECIHATDAGGDGDLKFLVFSHDDFRNCAEWDVSIQNSGTKVAHDILVENNKFAAPCSEQPSGTGNNCGPNAAFGLGCSATGTGGTATYNVDVRFNTFSGDGLYIDPTATNCSGLTTLRVYANIQAGYSTAFSCTSRTSVGLIYKYNVWTSGVNCGDATNVLSTTQVASPSVRNGAVGSTTYDFHLASCSVTSANFVAPATITGLGAAYGVPSVDYAGVARPAGTNLDVGAYEDCS